MAGGVQGCSIVREALNPSAPKPPPPPLLLHGLLASCSPPRQPRAAPLAPSPAPRCRCPSPLPSRRSPGPPRSASLPSWDDGGRAPPPPEPSRGAAAPVHPPATIWCHLGHLPGAVPCSAGPVGLRLLAGGTKGTMPRRSPGARQGAGPLPSSRGRSPRGWSQNRSPPRLPAAQGWRTPTRHGWPRRTELGTRRRPPTAACPLRPPVLSPRGTEHPQPTADPPPKGSGNGDAPRQAPSPLGPALGTAPAAGDTWGHPAPATGVPAETPGLRASPGAPRQCPFPHARHRGGRSETSPPWPAPAPPAPPCPGRRPPAGCPRRGGPCTGTFWPRPSSGGPRARGRRAGRGRRGYRGRRGRPRRGARGRCAARGSWRRRSRGRRTRRPWRPELGPAGSDLGGGERGKEEAKGGTLRG